MIIKRTVVLAQVLILAAFVGYSQTGGESPVSWSADPPQPVRAGQRLEVHVRAEIAGIWHLYSASQPPGGPNATRFRLAGDGPFRLLEGLRQSEFKTEFDPNFGINTEYFANKAEFWIPLEVGAAAASGEHTIDLQVIFQVCDDKVCLPPRRVSIPVKILVEEGSSAAVADQPPAVSGQPLGSAAEAGPAGAQGREGANPSSALATKPAAAGTAAEVAEARSGGFLPFLWLAMTMGAISLATPCVFPMIPITVSYFTKSAEKDEASAVSQALVYSVGIIFTFTGLGLGLAALLGATGINQFAANPWINLLITAIFVGFALNLFGLYQISVPSGVLTKLSRAGGGKGYLQTLLMGLTFTLTSFTCTVPFVGTVLVATSQGDWLWPAFGMLAFSTVFAAPFFVLALVPRMMTALPKSGAWLNSVKVTMGFLELAAAMKFISNVDLVWNWQIFTREVVLSVWLAIAVLTSVYLLGKFRLPHDTPLESLGVLRMTSSLVFLAIGFYLFTGLMGGSLGELDAFLPPRTSGSFTLTGAGAKGQELTWHRSLEPALAEARAERRPIFIDFTGYTCTNCRWMEANIFPLPEVHSKLERFVRLQLFTDGEGEEYERNQQYQKDRYGTVALPFYAILDPAGRDVATFPGMTRKSEEFLAFLESGISGAATGATTATAPIESQAAQKSP